MIKVSNVTKYFDDYKVLDYPGAADVNCDEKVNAKDTAILKRHIGGWDGYDSLPYLD